MTSQEMMKAAPCAPGYWFENIAPLGETPDWRERHIPYVAPDTLFGYEPKAFLRKQYR